MSRTHIAAAVGLIAAAALAAVLLLHHSGSGRESAPPSATVPASAPNAGVPAQAQLATATFTASYPRGWKVTTATQPNVRRFQLSSTGAAIEALDIPPAGTIGITLSEGRAATSAFAGVAPARLMRVVVGVPRGAGHVVHTAMPRAVALDGSPAAEESYAYVYRGRANVQADLLARHGDELVFIELDGEPRLAAASVSALTLLTHSWRWR